MRALCGPPPPPRQASLRKVRSPGTGELLDRGLALWLPGPASFTGEDIAELHIHGGRAVTGRVIEALTSLRGVRLAEPGEFARRAFENGRIDLTEVEGLADLIAAETEAQARQAIAQAEGGARALYKSWREELVKAQALAEAGLDFADEADVAADAAVQADASVAKLLAAMSTHLADRRGERLRDGFRVVIAGPPNAGKSSLLNALAQRDVAIVSEEAGTTRDVIEVHLDLGGLPVIVTDTAGIREAEGAVEAEGVRRALARVENADLVLWMVDATAPRLEDKSAYIPANAVHIRVLNKVDLVEIRTNRRWGCAVGENRRGRDRTCWPAYETCRGGACRRRACGDHPRPPPGRARGRGGGPWQVPRGTGRAGNQGRGAPHRRPPSRPPDGPHRRRGGARRHLLRVLYRQVNQRLRAEQR